MQEPTTSTAHGPQSFTGSCHCGAIAYETTVDLGGMLITCNCSMCSRSGTILTFVPPEAFALKRGEEALSEYEFNKHSIQHKFCKVCGIKPFATGTSPDGKKMVAINVRCLEGVDLQALTPTHVDGKSF